jgi:hypothetical protein
LPGIKKSPYQTGDKGTYEIALLFSLALLLASLAGLELKVELEF